MKNSFSVTTLSTMKSDYNLNEENDREIPYRYVFVVL